MNKSHARPRLYIVDSCLYPRWILLKSISLDCSDMALAEDFCLQRMQILRLPFGTSLPPLVEWLLSFITEESNFSAVLIFELPGDVL